MIKSSEEKELGITIESAYPRSTLVANAVRANLPNRIRSNTIACARNGKWRASQVMIDYLNSVRDEMPLHRFIEIYQGNKMYPHQKALLDMIEQGGNVRDITMVPVRFNRIDNGPQFFANNF